MHVKIIRPLARVTASFEGQGFSSISPASRGQLVKIFLNHIVYLDKKLHTYTFKHCRATGMQNYDETLPSISLAGCGR